jgi:hypothetical protein
VLKNFESNRFSICCASGEIAEAGSQATESAGCDHALCCAA